MWAGGLFVESEIRQTLKASETELRISVTVPRTLNATRKKIIAKPLCDLILVGWL